ncbi:MAG: hypothetical protein MAG551_00853 [Candidatus Scalindua arabica]|uniref:Uncharacterized protein n=1 Tax=Candidatus Scalindua arabica TaxID=1127984 RepID=A0A942A3E7_9BACT|nr:hypothetical protein [Candidatus Scalindua arabica]
MNRIFYITKLVTILFLLTALSGSVYADIDSLSEEELFFKLQAELPVIDHSNCVVIPEQKDSNYIYIYNLRSHIINLHPEWSTGVKESILNGDVKDGMTKKQVQASWGLPKDTKVNLDKSGTHELWHYGISVYLYFENGELSGRH